MSYFEWPPYVPVAEKRRLAQLKLAKLRKQGQSVAPVTIEGRTIAKTFWGKAWCDNLERYSDFSNRLPRGRTYVRNGSVVDLRISAGSVQALVSGSDLYEIQIRIAAVPKARWSEVRKDCAGAIDSLVELLQGRFSKAVMSRISEREKGLFPSPKEIRFECSCPDYASMCKHIAAVLYGIGARLDSSPELLFALRGVDHFELIAQAGQESPGNAKTVSSDRVLAADDLSSMFGIELAEPSTPVAAPKQASRRTKKPSVVRRKPVQNAKPEKRRGGPRTRQDPDRPTIAADTDMKESSARPPARKAAAGGRKALSKKMKARWAALRAGSRRRS
jgi:uncharacterized Zn finger protein